MALITANLRYLLKLIAVFSYLILSHKSISAEGIDANKENYYHQDLCHALVHHNFSKDHFLNGNLAQVIEKRVKAVHQSVLAEARRETPQPKASESTNLLNAPNLSSLTKPLTDPTAKPGYWGLSLNGGGVRGLLEILQLQYLEEITGMHVCDIFDYIGGTSIGGILSVGLSRRIWARDLTPLFLSKADEIFPPTSSWNVFEKIWSSVMSIIYNQYDDSTLNKLLQNEVGKTVTLRESYTNVMVTVVNPKTNTPSILDSRSTPLVLSWEAMRATAAAPTKFTDFILSTPQDPTIQGPWVDGGTWVNDPALQVYLQVKDWAQSRQQMPFSPDQIHLVSLSTGDMPVQQQLSSGSGLLYAAGPVVEMLMTTQQIGTQRAMSELLGPNYHLFNPVLASVIPLDKLTQPNIDMIYAAVASEKAKMDALVKSDPFQELLKRKAGRGL